MSKRDFHMIYQQHLSVITDRVIRLSLSEYEGTPKQINLFDSYLLSFKERVDELINSFRSSFWIDEHQCIVNETFFIQPIPSYIRLPNIEYLWIKLPINEQFWSIVPSLNRLYLLTVVSYIDAFQSQLKALLNRAPRLC
ncbi:unnamed protein product [Rotaria sordida]|uniref:Uncharacterized protein n=1 Tax=Rotaria sordida TaxID=392033 RepID=A0A819VYP8_9BILA|nr:unnamed protein product [Rotaria sordida]